MSCDDALAIDDQVGGEMRGNSKKLIKHITYYEVGNNILMVNSCSSSFLPWRNMTTNGEKRKTKWKL